MDSKSTIWPSLAEFLQSEKLSEYIPTFSTLDLKAFSKLTVSEIDSQVSPLYDRQRILDAVNLASACLEAEADTDPLRKLTPTNPVEMSDIMKTPTKSAFSHMKTSTPTKKYLAIAKSALRPTKSLSPPMRPKQYSPVSPSKLSLSSYEKNIGCFDLEEVEKNENDSTGGDDTEEGSNLVRLRRNLGSSDPSLSSADKSGENFELQGHGRSRSGRRATEYRLSAGEFSPLHSPCPSPRALSPCRPAGGPAALPNLNFPNFYNHRRWSVASSVSDYYSGSPSSLSSASSHERLYIPGYRVSDEDVSHGQLQRQLSLEAGKTRPRARARSLSPERQPEANLANETSFNIYKERFPQAKAEMERNLEEFVEQSHARSQGVVKSEASANFLHHRVHELATDIQQHSWEERITDTYFEEVSSTLERLIIESEKYSANMLPGVNNTASLVVKEASELLKIISRSARLLECLTFDVGSFYSKIQEGTIDELLRSTATLPRYISSRLSTKFGVIDSEEARLSPSHTPHPSSSGTEDEGLEKSSQFKEEDFEVRKLISNGAYGEVFLVRHVESKELFALKRIRKDRIIERSGIERAFMERDILSVMSNPFVVSMMCTFQTKTHLCMVIEYVEGGDVGTLLKRSECLETEMARLYHAETLLAVEYIHSLGIVHRDLKPENLLITKEGHIKLTDFGLSKCGLMHMAARTFENSVAAFNDEQGCIGTPDYIAPEVFYSRQYGFSVDWWSMGIILYQFLVGVTPFWGDTIEMLVDSIDRRNIDWPEEDPIDVEAKDLILCLLDEDPTRRLGAQGSGEVKKHPFYALVHWDQLFMHKAEYFTPNLDSEEDTFYFDTRIDRYDHSISEDNLPSVENNSHHIKYFDSVNWSSADHFIALNSPRNRHLSHDSIDSSTTDNQPSISTDDGHYSSGELQSSFQTSTPVRERCFSDSILRKTIKVKEKGSGARQTLTPDPVQTHRQTYRLVPKAPPPTPLRKLVKSGATNNTELYRNLCTPVKVNPSPLAPITKSPPTQPLFNTSQDILPGPAHAVVTSPTKPVTSSSAESSPEGKGDVESDTMERIQAPVPALRAPNKSPVKKLDLSSLHSKSGHVLEEREGDEDETKSGERTVCVVKGARGYGFTLNVIKVASLRGGKIKAVVRHLVSDVVPAGAAQEAGLMDNDLINAVDGVSTLSLTHQEVVEIVKNCDTEVELSVQHISHTTIQSRTSTKKDKKKKKRQSSFFRKAAHARGSNANDSLSMEKFLHLSRSRTREKQNSDSDKSGNEQDVNLMIHGQQLLSDQGSETESVNIKPPKGLRSKFIKRRASNNYVAPVSPLARTPSPTGHCYFAADSDRKAPRTAAQKTLHITHPRTQSLSSVTKREAAAAPGSAPAAAPGPISVSSPLSARKTLSPCVARRGTKTAPENTGHTLPSGPLNPSTSPASAVRGDHLSAVRGDHLRPANRQRKKSWVQAIEDKDIL